MKQDRSVLLTLDELVARILAMLDPGRAGRLLVAIAAPPGAGKSTMAALLGSRLDAAAGAPVAVVTPMDGFHLDNRLLAARRLLPRKGAPDTFDVGGLTALLPRLRDEPEVVFPLFDRERDLAIAGAGIVERHHRIVLLEGNYLLLDDVPWRGLASAWDMTIWIETDPRELERRLVRRWLDQGLSEAEAQARVRGNDIPNAERVTAGSRPATFRIAGA